MKHALRGSFKWSSIFNDLIIYFCGGLEDNGKAFSPVGLLSRVFPSINERQKQLQNVHVLVSFVSQDRSGFGHFSQGPLGIQK